MLWAFAGDQLKVLVEAGEVVEAAFVTELFDADPVIDEQLAGVSHPDLREELRIGLPGTGFEIPAEGIRHKSRDGGDFLQVDLLDEMAEGIIVNGIDPVILQLGKIRAKADGRQ